MKVFQDVISKLDSTEKHESNFGNLCMKNGGSFQKERFSFLLKSSMGGGGGPPCVRCSWQFCRDTLGIVFEIFAVKDETEFTTRCFITHIPAILTKQAIGLETVVPILGGMGGMHPPQHFGCIPPNIWRRPSVQYSVITSVD